MRSLIDIVDFSVEELNDLLQTACDISEHPEKYWDACKHKKLATLFFEPSTRTRLSFEAAMLELGGTVLGFSEAGSSSAARVKVLRILLRPSAAMQILLLCVIPRKAHPMSLPRQLPFL